MSQNSTGMSLIASSMLEHVNMWPDKPADCKLKLDKKAVSFMMQPLPGTKEIRRYVNGSFRGQWPFALYIRVTGQDTAARLDALRCLSDGADWLESSAMPVIGGNITAEKIESDLPSIAAQYDDGTEDYQAVFRLTFYHRRDLIC